jgi:hypothetical protein
LNKRTKGKLLVLNTQKTRNYLKYLAIIFAVFLIVGLYPGMGGEGAQRDISTIQNKLGVTSFIVIFVYGSMPDFLLGYLFWVSLLQLIFYIIGVYFILESLNKLRSKIFLILLSIVAFCFLLQVVRDATAFSFYVLATGLMIKSRNYTDSRKMIYLTISIFLILFGSLFKPVVAPIAAFFYFMLSERASSFWRSKIFSLLVLIILAVCPYFIDKALMSSFQIKNVHAEQPLFLYEISKMYCWGHDPKIVASAKENIKPFISIDSDHESLCASLEPMGWDDLRRSIPEVSKSPVLIYPGASSEIASTLFFKWAKLVQKNPFEWIQMKVIDASQVSVMANSLYIDPVIEIPNQNLILDIGDETIKLIFAPMKVLDRFRVFSIGFAFLLGLMALFINGRKTVFDKALDNIILKFLAINLANLVFHTMLFISNPGRYVLPFVLLSYIYVVIAYDEKSKTFYD